MTRANPSGISLTDTDAAIVKGMIVRGDRQHDIAAWFGVNGGRIGEISSGHAFANISPQSNNLPPPGPYLTGQQVSNAKSQLSDVRNRLSDLLDEVDRQISNL